MKKEHLNIILSTLILATFLYILKRNNLTEVFVSIKPTDFFIISSSVFVSVIAMSYRFKVLLLLFKQSLKINECIGLTVCLRMFNYYMPARGGVVPIAFYLKKKTTSAI